MASARIFIFALGIIATLVVGCKRNNNQGVASKTFTDSVAGDQSSGSGEDTDDDSVASQQKAIALLELVEEEKQELQDKFNIRLVSEGSEKINLRSLRRSKYSTNWNFSAAIFPPRLSEMKAELGPAKARIKWNRMLKALWSFGQRMKDLKNHSFFDGGDYFEQAGRLKTEAKLAGQWSGKRILRKLSESQEEALYLIEDNQIILAPVVSSTKFKSLALVGTIDNASDVGTAAKVIRKNCSEAKDVVKKADDFDIDNVATLNCKPGSLAYYVANVFKKRSTSRREIRLAIENLQNNVAYSAYKQAQNLLAANGLRFVTTGRTYHINKKVRKTWEEDQYLPFSKKVNSPYESLGLGHRTDEGLINDLYHKSVRRNKVSNLSFYVLASEALMKTGDVGSSSFKRDLRKKMIAAQIALEPLGGVYLQTLNDRAHALRTLPIGLFGAEVGTFPEKLEPNYKKILRGL